MGRLDEGRRHSTLDEIRHASVRMRWAMMHTMTTRDRCTTVCAPDRLLLLGQYEPGSLAGWWMTTVLEERPSAEMLWYSGIDGAYSGRLLLLFSQSWWSFSGLVAVVGHDCLEGLPSSA
ncbi:hypothetical protein J3458_004637 [Metarhizium acridum]|uniref:uncharacterized protein n=1 Tax=Metarhizium acridum TaxID=92637 RepID=UPI001C6CF41C|nr:hypothetical protein J3458_004637 [Metarhizium acridum]